MKRFVSIITVLSVLCLTISCEKNSFHMREMTYPEGKALVKVGHFIAYNANSPIRVAINGATISNELLYPIPFPGGGLNTNGSLNSDYLMVDPGSAKIELFVMNPGTPKPISKLFETSLNMDANKRYTLFLADTAANIAAWTVVDDTPAPDSGSARIKFVNAMPNVAAMDLYKGTNANVATLVVANIGYKGVSDYVNVPFGTDSFFVRKAGDPVSVAPIARRSFALSNQRIYTLFSRGYNGTTGNRAPNLSAIVNQ
ncbi:MAG TPA: DUF4397 domain-containing protein [Chitinophagaceae bacterium]